MKNTALPMMLVLTAILACRVTDVESAVIEPRSNRERAPERTANVSRQETWKGLEYWLRTSGHGFAAPLEKMQSEGFEQVYGGLMKTGTGSAISCTATQPVPLLLAVPVPVFVRENLDK